MRYENVSSFPNNVAFIFNVLSRQIMTQHVSVYLIIIEFVPNTFISTECRVDRSPLHKNFLVKELIQFSVAGREIPSKQHSLVTNGFLSASFQSVIFCKIRKTFLYSIMRFVFLKWKELVSGNEFLLGTFFSIHSIRSCLPPSVWHSRWKWQISINILNLNYFFLKPFCLPLFDFSFSFFFFLVLSRAVTRN